MPHESECQQNERDESGENGGGEKGGRVLSGQLLGVRTHQREGAQQENPAHDCDNEAAEAAPPAVSRLHLL